MLIARMFIGVFLLFMFGCSGGSSGGEGCGSNASCPPPQQPLNQAIVGLWERSATPVEGFEVLYSYVGEDGQYQVYDYEQDDFGTGENCYSLQSGTISNRFSNVYDVELVTEQSDAIGISTGTLTINFDGSDLKVALGEEEIREETWMLLEGVSREDLTICQ